MDVGVRLQQYEIVEHIGRGGMADVWSARDTSLGRMVAIKTIAQDLSAEQNPLLLFEQEARTIASLEHPHILPIYGFGQYQGKLYIVMRYVTGGSLEDALKDGTITFDYALKLTRSLADALQHAHSESVVHLDLKPPNILLDSKGIPYLADFGLATALGADGRARNPGAGTLLYMAPEQMTSEQIDHRADIYSFALVVHHIFTGRLPFSGSSPLALKQLQFQDRLPFLGDLNPDLPDELTTILRTGTALNPEDRYDTVIDLVTEIEAVLGVREGTVEGSSTGSSTFADLITDFDPAKVQQREAEDIYDRAHQAWSGGNGRFLLSVTHFMVMSDFYSIPEHYGLEIDKEGLEMLLRGALEYDYNVDYWWDQQRNNDSRRWVCLHAIRSESPGARRRAYDRLRRLPDTDPPRIPLQVAQALTLENDEAAALAGLGVLAERVQFVDHIRSFAAANIGKHSTIVDTIVRDGLQIVTPDAWHDFTYSIEIDASVADMALNGMSDDVRALAARSVGRMRSIAAVEALMTQRAAGAPGVIRALAYVLDEAPSLPRIVPLRLRLAAWLRNTGRRLTEQPMGIVWAFIAALMFSWLAMGQHIYRIFRAQAIFNQQRILNTFAIGLLFGFFVAVLVIVAKTLPERLRGFWPNWTRLVWSAVSGFYLSQLIWWAYVWMLLNLDSPPRDILVLTGLGTAVGLVVPAMVRMRGWAAFLLTTVTTFTVHLIGFNNFWSSYYGEGTPLNVRFPWVSYGGGFPFIRLEWFAFTTESWIFAYDQQSDAWAIMLPLVLLFALGVHFPALMADLRAILPSRGRTATVGVGAGAMTDPNRTLLEPPPPERRTGLFAAIAADEDELNTIQLAGATTPQIITDESGMTTAAYDKGRVGGRSIPQTEQHGPAGDVITEEFDMDAVGGRDTEHDTEPDTDWDALMGPLDARTEEFESNKVGGRGESAEPATDWDAILGPLDEAEDELETAPSGAELDTEPNTDRDALMGPLNARTEEFALADVGGHDESAEVETDWDTILGPLDEADEEPDTEDLPSDLDQYKDTVIGLADALAADADDPERFKNTIMGDDVQRALNNMDDDGATQEMPQTDDEDERNDES